MYPPKFLQYTILIISYFPSKIKSELHLFTKSKKKGLPFRQSLLPGWVRCKQAYPPFYPMDSFRSIPVLRIALVCGVSSRAILARAAASSVGDPRPKLIEMAVFTSLI